MSITTIAITVTQGRCQSSLPLEAGFADAPCTLPDNARRPQRLTTRDGSSRERARFASSPCRGRPFPKRLETDLKTGHNCLQIRHAWGSSRTIKQAEGTPGRPCVMPSRLFWQWRFTQRGVLQRCRESWRLVGTIRALRMPCAGVRSPYGGFFRRQAIETPVPIWFAFGSFFCFVCVHCGRPR